MQKILLDFTQNFARIACFEDQFTTKSSTLNWKENKSQLDTHHILIHSARIFAQKRQNCKLTSTIYYCNAVQNHFLLADRNLIFSEITREFQIFRRWGTNCMLRPRWLPSTNTLSLRRSFWRPSGFEPGHFTPAFARSQNNHRRIHKRAFDHSSV